MILYLATNESLFKEFVDLMSTEFEMSMTGELNLFLGLQIKQTERGTMIHQQKYVKELLKKYGTGTRLDEDSNGKSVNEKQYRGMNGFLINLTVSRLDIAFSVGLCARFQSNPKKSHLTTVKRILRYSKGSEYLCLFYSHSDIFDLEL